MSGLFFLTALLSIDSPRASDQPDPRPVCNDGLTCFASASKCVSDGDFVENQGYSAHARSSLVTEVVCVAHNGIATKYSRNSIQSVSSWAWDSDAPTSRALSVKKCETEIEELKAGYGPCTK